MIDLGIGQESKNMIFVLAVIMFILAVVSCITTVFATKISARIATKFAADVRRCVFEKNQNLSAANIDQFGTASLITRTTSDITNIQMFLSLLLRMGVMAPLMAVAGLVLSSATGGKVSSILNIAIPILMIVVGIVVVFSSKYSTVLRKRLDEMNRIFLENLEGVRVIRAFNKQSFEMSRFQNVNKNYTEISVKTGKINALINSIIQVIFGITIAAVLGVGAIYVSDGSLQVGALVANSQYITMILMSVMLFAIVIIMFPMTYACAKRVEEVLQISLVLSVIAIVMVPVSIFASLGVMKASAKHYSRQQECIGRLNGFIEEMYQGHLVVQSFNYKERAMEKFDAMNRKLEDSARNAEAFSGMIMPITSVVNNLGYVISAVIGCLYVLSGKMTVGNVQAMLQYTKQFSQPFASIAGMAGNLGAANAAAKRIFALLNEEEEIPDIGPAKTAEFSRGEVVFSNVSFGYTEGNTLMKNVSFTVKPGQKVAIVGPTGAGKTTLINLLMRFYEIGGGEILLNGINTKEMTRHELRKHFGMVLLLLSKHFPEPMIWN